MTFLREMIKKKYQFIYYIHDSFTILKNWNIDMPFDNI